MTPEIIWGSVGLALIIADLIFGTFFMLFLGGAALVTASLVWAGAIPNPTYQWLFFAALSAVSMLLFRKKLVEQFGSNKNDAYNEFEGQVVEVVDEIKPPNPGRVKFRGAEWIAQSHDDVVISAGDKAVIVNKDGIVLIVKAR
jgi:membrane protein implicated in regulation of membrane protease activity